MKKLFILLLMIPFIVNAKDTKPNSSKNVNVLVETSLGDLEIELNVAKAPVTVSNFLKYVDEGFYNGTVFHRVIGNFMIQGGGFNKDLVEKKTKASIKNEATNGLGNVVGTIAMARTPDPHSASAQFFINVADNSFLNHRDTSDQGYGYAVFGRVVSGMPVVEKIKNVKTGSRGMYDDVPLEPVVIKSIKRKK